NDFVATFADLGQRYGADQDDDQHQEAQRYGSGHKYRGIAVRDQHCATQMFFDQRPQNEGQDQRSHFELPLAQADSKKAESAEQDEIERTVVDGKDPNAAHDQDQQVEQPIRHFEHRHPDADERQIDDDE